MSDTKMVRRIQEEWTGTGTYNIGFLNEFSRDETQFYAESPAEMADLLTDFFAENGIDDPTGQNIEYLEMVSDENI